jgi:TolB-like protein/Flp pilus assembly protein TadD
VDATTGHHLWADRYDRELKDIFVIQDDITQKIVVEMAVKLAEGENERVMRHPTGNVEAWIHYRRAVAAFRKFTKESTLKSRELCEKAIELDPGYSVAYSLLGYTYSFLVRAGFSKSPAQDLNKAEELVKKAQELDPKNPDAQNQLGFIYMLRGDYDRAIEEGKKAVELAPNVAATHAHLAASQIFSGQYQEAIAGFKQAMRLAPFYPWWYAHMLGQAYFCAGLYDEALPKFEEALKRAPDPTRLAWKAATYQALGRTDEARATIEEALTLKPTFSVEQWRKRHMLSYRDKAQVDRILAYGRQAGLPEKPPLPLPDKPSIAVLAFENMSGDPEQEYFSDGLSEEIITALSKTPKLFVIARNSSFTYKGNPVKVQQIGRELGVKYVLEGSVRKSGDRVRITAQLVDAKTENHLWAERYDRDLKGIFALQDEITLAIIRAMRVELTAGEQASVTGKGTENLDAYLKALQAHEQFYLMNKEGSRKAKQLVKEAIALDPKYAFPHATLANAHMLDVWFKFSASPKDSMRLAVEAAQKALTLDASDPRIHYALTNLYIMQRQYEKAIASAERAVELSPSGARAYGSLGTALFFACRFNKAIQSLEQAIRLNPYPPSVHFRILGGAYRGAGRYEEAITEYKKALRQNPDDIFTHLGLAVIYIKLGREEEARAEAKEVMRIHPKFSLDYFAKVWHQKDQSVVDDSIVCLRKAGLPE